jgi:hypothetical protein
MADDQRISANPEDLVAHLQLVWEEFHKRHLQNPIIVPVDVLPHVHINPRLVVEAANHSLVDLERMAELHLKGHKKPDRHKWAGFVAKWIAKIRPIYIDSEVEIDANLHFINADFAVWVLRSFLEESIPFQLAEQLQYMLHYRDEKGETLSVIAYCAEEISRLRRQTQESS